MVIGRVFEIRGRDFSVKVYADHVYTGDNEISFWSKEHGFICSFPKSEVTVTRL